MGRDMVEGSSHEGVLSEQVWYYRTCGHSPAASHLG
jgi:hypothetical protein